MYSSRICKDLGDSECAVWCRLSPGIDPGRWAGLCRYLGSISPGEFDQITFQIRHKRLTTAFKKQIMNIVELIEKKSPNAPLVSIGPSGIGGRYQRER